MPDNNYQASITKLEALHNSVIKSEDDRNFFSLLYKYMEFICNGSVLEARAWSLFRETYLQDHGADEYNSDLKVGTFEENFTKVLNDYRGDSRFYNSWLYLYIFYNANTESLGNTAIIAINAPNLETPEGQTITAIIQNEMRSTKFRLDNSGKTELKRSDFSLYLEVFHHDFIDMLQTYTEQTTKVIKYVGNAEIYYENNMTYVSLPTEKEPLKLRKLDIKPSSGYDYFLNYMFDPKNEGQLITNKDVQELHIKCEPYADIGEVLRHCGFNIVLKRVFMPKRRDHDGFIYQKQMPVTEKQVEDIKKAIAKIVAKS